MDTEKKQVVVLKLGEKLDVVEKAELQLYMLCLVDWVSVEG